MLVGQHAAGTAVRCLAAVSLPPPPPFVESEARGPASHDAHAPSQRWAVVSAGAKEVHMAWTLELRTLRTDALAAAHVAVDGTASSCRPARDTVSGVSGVIDHSEGSHLEVCKAAILPPPKGGLNPKQNKGFNTSDAERRTMALCAFAPLASGSSRTVAVVSAASNACVRLSILQLANNTWQPAALLVHHTRPVLSLAHVLIAHGGACACGDTDGIKHSLAWSPLGVRAPAERSCAEDIVFTGATDGSIALWDVTSAACDVPDSATAKSGQGQHRDAAPLARLRPVWHTDGSHQSGVNAMAAVAVQEGALLITGGDDQVLCAKLFARVSDGMRCVASCTVPCAHASAIKGITDCCHLPAASARVWVCSVGLDQMLRVWRTVLSVDADDAGFASVTLTQVAVHKLDVSEPTCVHGTAEVMSCGGKDAHGNSDRECVWHLVVGGRGTQSLSLTL